MAIQVARHLCREWTHSCSHFGCRRPPVSYRRVVNGRLLPRSGAAIDWPLESRIYQHMTCPRTTAKRDDDLVDLEAANDIPALGIYCTLPLGLWPGRSCSSNADYRSRKDHQSRSLYRPASLPGAWLASPIPGSNPFAGATSTRRESSSPVSTSMQVSVGLRFRTFGTRATRPFGTVGPRGWKRRTGPSRVLWVFKLGLVVDLSTAQGIVAVVVAVCEWWRRRRWRYSLRCFAAILVGSARLAWSVRGHQLESRTGADLRNSGLEVSCSATAPCGWELPLEKIICPFLITSCASGMRTWASLHRKDMDRWRRAVTMMADNAKHLRWLQHLFLDSMPVTDADLRNIEAWTELEVLCLDGTQVTDAGLEYIRDLPHFAFSQSRPHPDNRQWAAIP